jgi:two-component system sensor histidine kinase PilS (NtrC family)
VRAAAQALILPASPSSTRDRLLLLNLFRVLVATVLLAATFLFGGNRSGALPLWNTQHLLYHATGTMIVMSLLFSYAIERVRQDWALNALGMTQFVFDTAFASVLVLVTGGLDSVFTFFYSLFIINASIVLYWTGALVAALASTVMLLCVALVQYGVLYLGPAQPFVEQIFPELDAGLHNWSQLVLNFATNIVAFYAVAFLSSFLAEQVREADNRLSAQKAGMEKLRRLHQNIIQSLDNGLITLNTEHRVTLANHWAMDWLELDQDAIVGEPVMRFFPDLGPILTNPDKSGRAVSETTIQMRGGRKTFTRWTINPLRDSRGTILGRVVLFWDVTDVMEMEKAIERGARMATIGRLAASIAHEIRNPLASMSGSIQLLRSLMQPEGDEKRLMDIVVREADHLNHWITEFLAYAKPRRAPRQRVDLAAVCAEVTELISNEPRAAEIAISFEVHGDGSLSGEVNGLRQIVWNLVNNAVDATPPKGRVTLRLDGTNQGQIVLDVEDTGEGIPPEVQEKIFDPFFSTKEMGTGLGLATVQHNVEQQGGTVRVSSAPGRGSTFRVVLSRVTGGSGR